MTRTTRRTAFHSPLLAAAIALAFVAPGAEAAGPKRNDNYDQFIVKFKDGTPAKGNVAARQRVLDSVGRSMGLHIGQLRRMAVGADVIRTDRVLDPKQIKHLIARFRQDPNVEYAEPDLRVYPLFTPNDTRYAEQWHYFEAIGGLNLPLAWDLQMGGSGQVVAVLDTGILPHSDLDANVVAGYDFITSVSTAGDGGGRDADPTDPGDFVTANQCGGGEPAENSSWHGTHVAGTIAAVTNNSAGVAGVAFGAKVSALRVLGKCGGSTSDINDAIVWASGGAVGGVPANANPAKIINMSLGGGGSCLASTQTAINTAVANGTTVVVAAGNSNADAGNFQPASCANVITIGATDRTGGRASYSNYGTTIDVAAPGGGGGQGILSTLNAGATTAGAESYAGYQGTSMASPHVAGVVALAQAEAGGTLTPAQMESLIKVTTRTQPVSCSLGCGTGIVDAHAAVLAATTAVLNITDPVDQVEGNSGTHVLTFTVNLSRAVGSDVTFDIATSNGTATAGSDYVAKTSTAQVIPAGQLSKTFTVTVNGDTSVEDDETFFADITNVSGPVTVIDDQGVAQIVADDLAPPTVMTSGVALTGLSGATSSDTYFQLAVPAGATNLRFEMSGGTGDADMYVRPGSLPNGSPSESGTCVPYVTGNTETCAEPDITTAAGTWYVLLDAYVAYSGVTLTGTYDLPIGLSIGDVSYAEGDAGTKTMTFTVQLSAVSASAVVYDIDTANDTASAPTDYTAKSLNNETIPAGQLSKTFTVTTNGDTTNEANEAFFVNLSGVTGATLTDGQAVGTLTNDDGAQLSITDAIYAEGAAGTSRSMTFTVSLSEASASDVSFTIGTANDTATAGSDYVAKTLAGQVIPAGQLTKTFTVLVGGDATVEPNETFNVNLSAATNASILDGTGVGSIINDDGVYLRVDDVRHGEGNSGTKTMTFTVRLSQAALVPVTYNIATSNNTASAGSDYVASALVGESIPAGQLTKTFTVTTNGDTTLENNEWFNLNVTNVTGSTIYDGAAIGILLNDEGPTLSISDAQHGEGNSGGKLMTFTATLSEIAAVPVTFNVSTANSSALAGSDYTGTTYSGLSIPAGQLSRTFTVVTVGDTSVETNEWFNAKLGGASGATIFDDVGMGIIINDDGPVLSVDDVAITEGGAGGKLMTFTVTLSQAAASNVTYNIATSNLTAIAGSDYVAKSLTGETIAAGMLSKTFSVAIAGDGVAEPNETFRVRITGATVATIFDEYGTGTITNDD